MAGGWPGSVKSKFEYVATITYCNIWLLNLQCNGRKRALYAKIRHIL